MTPIATQIQWAQTAYMVAASQLLDQAEEVRRQRDELIRLVTERDAREQRESQRESRRD